MTPESAKRLRKADKVLIFREDIFDIVEIIAEMNSKTILGEYIDNDGFPHIWTLQPNDIIMFLDGESQRNHELTALFPLLISPVL